MACPGGKEEGRQLVHVTNVACRAGRLKSRAREPAASMRTVTLRARAVKLAEGAPGERRPPDDCLRSEAQTPSEPLRPCHAVHRLRLCELPLPLIRLEELRPVHRLLHRRGASFLSAVLTLGSSVWHGSASPSGSPCRRLRRLHQSVLSEASMATRLVSQQARAAMLLTQQMAEDVQREQGRARTSSMWVVRAVMIDCILGRISLYLPVWYWAFLPDLRFAPFLYI